MIYEHGDVLGGAGGKLNGKHLDPKTKSANRINEKTSQFANAEFKPHEPSQKTRTTAEIKAEMAYKEKAHASKMKEVASAAKNDRVFNEGGGGYSHSEVLSEKYGVPHMSEMQKLRNELFEATWTPEVTHERRAVLNKELAKAKSYGDVAKIQERLGYTGPELKRAMAMHGIT